MSNLTLQIKRIDEVRPRCPRFGGEYLEVTCEMSKADMCAVFGEFLKHITESDIAEWLKEYGLEHLISDREGQP